jgi:hypothetical protein
LQKKEKKIEKQPAERKRRRKTRGVKRRCLLTPSAKKKKIRVFACIVQNRFEEENHPILQSSVSMECDEEYSMHHTFIQPGDGSNRN